jgi:thymidylate synthase
MSWNNYGTGFNELYWRVIKDLLGAHDVFNERTHSRTKEIRAASLTLLAPECNILTSRVRNLNYAFSVAEWLWMMTGRNDVKTLEYFNSHIAKFSDDGETFAGAYGPALVQQLPWVIQQLSGDNSTRQAVLTLWERRPPRTKDTPCTIMFQFFVRENVIKGLCLEMIAYMRSNDAWLGLPYDVFNFTQIQRYVASALALPPGLYTHIVGSLHLYEPHFDAAEELVEEHYDRNITFSSSPRVLYPLPHGINTALDVTSGGNMHNPYKLPEGWRPYVEVLNYYVARKSPHYDKESYGVCPQPWQHLYKERDNVDSNG